MNLVSISKELDNKKKSVDEYIVAVNSIIYLEDFTQKVDLDKMLLMSNMKACVTLMLYNAVESTITHVLMKVHEYIISEKLFFKDLNDDIGKSALSYYNKCILNSGNAQSVEKSKFVQFSTNRMVYNISFEEMNKIKKIYSGDLNLKVISDTLKQYGITFEGKCSEIDTVYRHRNNLAHGNMSFEEVGRDLTVQQLKAMTTKVFNYLNELLHIASNYLDDHLYKKDIIVSIIIPIHDTGEYLAECLGSIMFQELSDWELICVDDNSSDLKTRMILLDYENRYRIADKKIRILYSKENIGAAKCRNWGLKEARGKYVIFLDSDDYFDKTLLMKLYESITKNNSDIAICGFYRRNIDGKIQEHLLPINYENLNKEKQIEYSLSVPWNRMCKKEYLVDKKIHFESYSSCNDVYYYCMTILCCDSISIVNEPLITYRVGHSSQISYSRNPSNVIAAFNDIYNYICQDDNKDLQSCVPVILKRIFLGTISEILNRCKDENLKNKSYYELRKYVLNHRKEFDKIIPSWDIDNLINKAYESKWFMSYDFYYSQLKWRSAKLIKLINESPIILCGIGKRGNSFIKWCIENNVALIGLCDKKDDRCGEMIDGIIVYSREEALRKKVIFIASNQYHQFTGFS